MYSSDTSTLNSTRTRAELQYNFLPVPSADLKSSIKSSISSKSSKLTALYISSKQVHNASNLIYLIYLKYCILWVLLCDGPGSDEALRGSSGPRGRVMNLMWSSMWHRADCTDDDPVTRYGCRGFIVLFARVFETCRS